MPESDTSTVPEPTLGLKVIDIAFPTVVWSVVQSNGISTFIKRDSDGLLNHMSDYEWRDAFRKGYLVVADDQTLPNHEYTHVASDALAEVVWDFENLSEAKTIGAQSSAFIELSNSIADLSTWHPKFDIETGEIARPEGED